MAFERERVLRAVRFETPEAIPIRCHINGACWHRYPEDALIELIAEHPNLFPDTPAERPPAYAPWRRAQEDYVDSWGCVWTTPEDGITGAVTQHPLADWAAFDVFQPPDPALHSGWGPIDWGATAHQVVQRRTAGKLTMGSLRHGHTFLTLLYVRGYERVILDMADREPRLCDLLGMIEAFNAGLVSRFVDLGVEWMSYPEDLGMQRGPMLSPLQFKRWIVPIYRRLIAPAREAGCVIHMHSDGDIRTLCDDLLAVGVDVINLQDLVNGIDWIAAHLKGRVCIDLDIDRQRVTRFGTPHEIDALIRREVEALGSREGGLMLNCGLYAGIPIENMRALLDALERYAGYYADA